MKEENDLKQAYGTQAPFKVPEGYFDDFATRMMQMLPEQEAKVIEMKPSGWLRWRPYRGSSQYLCDNRRLGFVLLRTKYRADHCLFRFECSCYGDHYGAGCRLCDD